jgi:hypothetical protein
MKLGEGELRSILAQLKFAPSFQKLTPEVTILVRRGNHSFRGVARGQSTHFPSSIVPYIAARRNGRLKRCSTSTASVAALLGSPEKKKSREDAGEDATVETGSGTGARCSVLYQLGVLGPTS